MARGIQNKLLEAMAMGLPTVTTTAAHSGLKAEGSRDLFVADDPAGFASAVIRLLNDSHLRADMGRRARAAVEVHYGWDQSLALLDSIITTVTGNRTRSTESAVALGKV
jgi:glycosyltransferase involved in cell wall biosynthesis